jgi:signal transduction histidine kinase
MDVEQKELTFFGKIAAGVTHEMRNVLAIINESNGLMSDLLEMAKDSSFPYRDKFLRSISKIEAQVRRGVAISGNFNHFAHSMDNPIANVDLNEIVEQTVALARRFAGLKNIELQASPSSDPVFLITSPFRLQMALTKAVEAGIAYLPEGGVIELQVDGARDCPCVYVNFDTPGGCTAEFREAISTFRTWQDLLELSVQLDTAVEWRSEADGIRLALPKSLQGRAAPVSPN